MTKRIFRAIFYVSLLVFLSCGLLLVAFVGEYMNKRQQQSLQIDAVYIVQGIKENGMEYLNHLPSNDARVTWIDADGTVLFDSKADVTQMENHLQREEVQEAVQTGTGQSSRFSTTLAERAHNYAVKLEDGSILRVSVTSLSALSLFLTILQPMSIVLVLALVLAGFLASKTSKSITKPLEEVDLEHPERYEIYDELAPFMRRIAVQQKLIVKQMKEQQCRQREFRTITENMQEGLLVLDAKGEVLFCNGGAMRLLHIEQPIEKESIFALNRTESFRRCVHLALSGKHTEITIDTENKSYKLWANPVMEENLVAGVILLLLDNTEKADREKLRREFTANVSHELKTPLTSISGFAEIMKNGIVKSEDVPRFAGNIYDEAQRLISMVQDIIELSRLDESEEHAEKVDVDISKIAQEVSERLTSVAQKRGIVLETKIAQAHVQGIQRVLEEMIYNLCDNAIRYNKDNGTVKLEVQHTTDEVLVTVTDTGIGIAQSEQERIFERFYRVSRSRSKDIDGTGLGLSIVKHGAKLHDAVIELESEIDKGTMICLHFPKYDV